MPVPRPGQVLGLVGTNGIGKSTALKVLAGKLKPNLGRFNVNLLILYGIFVYILLILIKASFILPEPSRLARNFDLLPGIRVAKLLYTYS